MRGVVGVLGVSGHGLGKYSRLRLACAGARGWTTAGWRCSFPPMRGGVKWSHASSGPGASPMLSSGLSPAAHSSASNAPNLPARVESGFDDDRFFERLKSRQPCRPSRRPRRRLLREVKLQRGLGPFGGHRPGRASPPRSALDVMARGAGPPPTFTAARIPPLLGEPLQLQFRRQKSTTSVKLPSACSRNSQSQSASLHSLAAAHAVK